MTAPTPRRLRRMRRRVVLTLGLAGTRATFIALRAVAPAAAERKALDAWVTLPRGRRVDARPEPGRLVRLAAPASGATVVAEVWGPDDAPAVYLVHGWGGWRGQLGAFVAPLREAGFRVVAVDAPGHGEAEPGAFGPGRGAVTEMIEAFELAVDELGRPAGVVAHSLGTTVAIAALRAGLPVDRLVLVSPNPAFADLLEMFARMLWIGRRAKDALRRGLEEFTGRPLDDFDIAPAGADGAMPDTLVVHDLDDRQTPHAVAVDITTTWPNATLLTTRGLGHSRILADPDVVRAAVGHLAGAGEAALAPGLSRPSRAPEAAEAPR